MNTNDSVSFKRLDIIHTSKVTSAATSLETWDRYYHLTFESGKLTVENNYKCIAEAGSTIVRATNGGIFGSPNNIVASLAITNNYFSTPPTDTTTVTTYYEKVIETTWYYTDGHAVTMTNIIGKDNVGYKSIMTIYGTETPVRTKVYYLVSDESTAYTKDAVIYGKFSLLFS